MTEITDKTVKLTPAIERFVLHWGDLGGSWGVNRSVAQIHALLLISERPLTAEEIAATLGLARSNVSNSMRDLLSWDLVRRAPILGDRRDHFEAEGDVWEMVTKIVAIRKARELDPAAEVLRACLAEAQCDRSVSPLAVRRLKDLQELVDTLDDWYEQMNAIPKSKLLPLIKMGAKAVDLLTPFLGKKEKEKN
jgi:DNA-binding transcriptional regulator GbsR (MarR family)